MLRVLSLALGLAAGAGAAQLPEFSQQYRQRLGGAVEELGLVVGAFDASARAVGLSRTEALRELAGTPFLERRAGDMGRAIARYERLRTDLAALGAAEPMLRPALLHRYRDEKIAREAWAAFEPSVPLTGAGAGYGAAGLLAGLFAASGLGRLLGRLMGRRRRA